MNKKSNQPSRVKTIFYYFKKSVKFYDMDNPLSAQIVFLLLLGVVFGGYVFARPYTEQFNLYFEQVNVRLRSMLETQSLEFSFLYSDVYLNMVNSFYYLILILVAIRSVSYIIGIYYGSYYYHSLTYPDAGPLKRTAIFFKRMPKIIFFNILFYAAFYLCMTIVAMVFGIASFIIPIFIMFAPLFPLIILAFDSLFVFKNLLIIEFNVGIFRNFKKSLDITRGCKKNVIINSMWPLSLNIMLSILALDAQTSMLSLFVAAFVEVIVILISNRLTALMFIDAASMEQQDKKTEMLEEP